jgi:glycine oxidase
VHQLSKHTAIAYQTLNQQQINHLEPDLANRFASGLLLEDEAHIDNRQLLNVLISECIENGVKIVDQQTVDIVDNSICSSGEKVSYDWVFDCRGTGAKKQLANLRGVRGEVLRVHCPAVKLSRPVRLMHPRYQLYLVPKPDQHFVIGATQIESEDTSPVSVQSMLELCSAMYSINPAFAEARIVEQNTNLRPALADNKPQILVNQQQVSINGLFRHGFLIAPAIVNSVIDWLDGKECPHFNSLFSFSE